MKPKQKDEFFQAIHQVSFRARVATLIKSNIPLEYHALGSADLAMQLLINLTLRASPLDISNDILVLDDAPDSFLQSLRIHFTQAYKQ